MPNIKDYPKDFGIYSEPTFYDRPPEKEFNSLTVICEKEYINYDVLEETDDIRKEISVHCDRDGDHTVTIITYQKGKKENKSYNNQLKKYLKRKEEHEKQHAEWEKWAQKWKEDEKKKQENSERKLLQNLKKKYE